METSVVNKSAKYILDKIQAKPEIAVILGSGLGSLMDGINNQTSISYSEIPNFPSTSIQGHDGKLIFGEVKGKNVIAMKGRFHYYEGHEMDTVTFPVKVFFAMGIRKIIITNAAGGVNKAFLPGDLMLINDHLGFACPSPLRGENNESVGPRFPDMSQVYSKKLSEIALSTAKLLGIELKQGNYMFSKGPQFETPAEIRAVRLLGADAVGMSTVPEAIVANHMGMEILAISTITNMAAGVLDKPLCHEEVIETGKMVSEKFTKLINKIIEKI
ncbi:MAG: purine-nucleoside phosphorylase [Bacillota bacterium]